MNKEKNKTILLLLVGKKLPEDFILVYMVSIVTSSNLIVVAFRSKISGLQLLSTRYFFDEGIIPFSPVPRV